MPERSFKDLVVVITGASSGIGAALSYQLAEQGAKLVISARNMKKLSAVEETCRAKGAEVVSIQSDVTSKSECEQLISAAVQRFGTLDMLINNAGISMGADFQDVKDIEFYQTLMDVNYFGSLYCTHYALPHLLKSKGRILAISSLAGKTGVPARTGYAAAKHAVAGFFDSLRIELMAKGVSVTVIYPGFVATDLRTKSFNADGGPLNETFSKSTNAMTAEECARQSLVAALGRKRQVVMTTRAKIAQWLRLIAPRFVDRVALKAIETSRDQ